MELVVKKPGMLTSVQDLGRWGYQSSGVPVAGAMDLPALRLGNAMLGNPQEAAALEVTLIGPELEVIGCGAAVFTGADLGFSVNERTVGSWRAVVLTKGDVVSFSGSKGEGCRGYLCLAGGVEAPVVMGSRSTYMRAKIGGIEGRALKAGDVINSGEPAPLWRRLDGFRLPEEAIPAYTAGEPLAIMTGLQEEAFTDKGKQVLFESEYIVTAQSDRMGCRLEGPKVEHTERGADIVSDAIPLGAVQIPGHGMPIIMLADRQTTGGYTKIGVLTPLSIASLVQKVPGTKVRFRAASVEEGALEQRRIAAAVNRAGELRLSYVSCGPGAARPLSGSFRLTLEGKTYDISCEEILKE
ncbi:hypothetical protein JS73_06550 [Synergistes jonesii]|uniref:Carboxyltransferase domain-containing protein n=2 Tax=Synergistes jonesii TaxID=2754 RepID=A0A073IR43_9BACT|nr:hypothetical protein EH55_04365 [Synergistes jonesii]OFB62697.1 hypothetical protein JS73_06550 [Synergistes jonesii]OFB63404.1 hypothetical protein JS79_07070 [Synergistes jonesii]OFB65553.1 hypothetical protein JS72_02610 [Synergistes jonesii]OFB67642.1 hypothetical protein JS78_06555 [Synergistes jonesii]